MTEYEELKAAGLTDEQIGSFRNMGATHAAILDWARKHPNVRPDCDYCGEDGHGEDECPVLRKERRQAEADYEGPLRGE